VRRRFRGGVRRGGRRTVAWIPGYSTNSTGAPVGSALQQALALVPGSPNTYGFGSALVTDADLSLHGGEDAVLVRILGTLTFYNALTAAAGAVPGWARVTIGLEDTQGDAQQVREWVSGSSLGRDNSMYTETVFVPADDALGAGQFGTTILEASLHIDVKAKRRIKSDSKVFLQFQMVTPLVPTTVKVAGHLRMLLMRPR